MCDSNLIVITSYFVVFDHTSPPHYPYIYWKPWEKGKGGGRKRKMWKKALFGFLIYFDVRWKRVGKKRKKEENVKEIIIWFFYISWCEKSNARNLRFFFFYLRKKKYLISKYQWGYNWKYHSLNKQKFQKKKNSK